MELFVLRHGEASYSGCSDESRELTGRGRLQVQQVLRQKLSELENVQLVLNSPLMRAQQSADIFLAYIPDVQRHSIDWLKPGSNVLKAIQSLCLMQQQKELRSAVLVTHLPFVASFVESLCGFQSGSVSMDTGSLIAIDCDVVASGCGELRWQLN